MKYPIQTALAVLLMATTAYAQDYALGDLTVLQPRTFEKPQAVNVAGGYLILENSGTNDDTLLEVQVADVPRVELHLSETDANGVARMIKQDGIPVPAGETVTLQPGGLHVMFMGLGGTAFEQGDQIKATLVFEQSGTLDVVFDVVARGANDHKAMDHSGHKMSD